MEIKVTVTNRLELESGESKTGNTWTKQTFVGETEGQYAKKIAFDFMGDKADQVGKLKKGDVVTVSFDVSSREYQGRWYTNCNGWNIKHEGEADPLTKSAEQLPGDSLPF